MRSAALGLLLCLAAACGGKDAPQCTRASTVGGTDSPSCRAARALLFCPTVEGAFCACVTDEESCADCPPRFHGVVCESQCGSDQYAVECSASSSADAGPVVVVDDPPPGCHVIAIGAGART